MTTELTTLAADIRESHEAAIAAGRSALEHARCAGELLVEAKRQVGHGTWLVWLRDHCPTLSARTAQVYMRIAREWPALEAKAQRVADLPVREALALLATPQDTLPDAAALLRDAQELDDRGEQVRLTLAGLRDILDLPNATLDELSSVVRIARRCEADAWEVRLRAERGLSVVQEHIA